MAKKKKNVKFFSKHWLSNFVSYERIHNNRDLESRNKLLHVDSPFLNFYIVTVIRWKIWETWDATFYHPVNISDYFWKLPTRFTWSIYYHFPILDLFSLTFFVSPRFNEKEKVATNHSRYFHHPARPVPMYNSKHSNTMVGSTNRTLDRVFTETSLHSSLLHFNFAQKRQKQQARMYSRRKRCNDVVKSVGSPTSGTLYFLRR